jgi:ATP synthase protein I
MTEHTLSGERRDRPEDEADAADEATFKTLSREEAEALRAKHPPVSPWRVIAVQAAVGLALAALLWAVTRRSELGWSALYGAAAVVLPGALLARGMARSASAGVGAAALNFMLWEAVKIGCAVVMLVAAASVVPGLSWPALLVAMLVCMKVNWLALLWQGRAEKNERAGQR